MVRGGGVGVCLTVSSGNFGSFVDDWEDSVLDSRNSIADSDRQGEEAIFRSKCSHVICAIRRASFKRW